MAKFNSEEEIGKIYSTNAFGDLKIIENLGCDKNRQRHVKVEFIDENIFGEHTICEDVLMQNVKHGKVKDRYKPFVYGTGCIGNAQCTIDGENTREYELWKGIIRRCYYEKDISYKNYGAKGVTVCDRWKCFEYFLQDLPYIPGYQEWYENPRMYSIDKDILQQDVQYNEKEYSPGKCMFVPYLENSFESFRRNNIRSSGYYGVEKSERIDGSFTYVVIVDHARYGVFDDPIAAANEYNTIAASFGYPIEYLNNVPYMSPAEIDKHRITVLFCKPIK